MRDVDKGAQNGYVRWVIERLTESETANQKNINLLLKKPSRCLCEAAKQEGVLFV